jgi:hypothetical protein
VTGRFVDLAVGCLGVAIDVIAAADQQKGETSDALFLSIWGTLLGGGGLLVDTQLETDNFEWPLNLVDDIATGLGVTSILVGAGIIVADEFYWQ